MNSRRPRFTFPIAALTVLLLSTASVRSEEPPATAFDAETIATIAKTIEFEGTLKKDVYTITVPRADLDLYNDNGPIPTAAGIESTFHFYKCGCGKTNVVGQFVLPDYEANDVMDALRKDQQVSIVSMSPMLLDEHPKLLAVRFQGEGTADELARTIKAALDKTGASRMTTRPVEKQ